MHMVLCGLTGHLHRFVAFWDCTLASGVACQLGNNECSHSHAHWSPTQGSFAIHSHCSREEGSLRHDPDKAVRQTLTACTPPNGAAHHAPTAFGLITRKGTSPNSCAERKGQDVSGHSNFLGTTRMQYVEPAPRHHHSKVLQQVCSCAS